MKQYCKRCEPHGPQDPKVFPEWVVCGRCEPSQSNEYFEMKLDQQWDKVLSGYEIDYSGDQAKVSEQWREYAFKARRAAFDQFCEAFEWRMAFVGSVVFNLVLLFFTLALALT